MKKIVLLILVLCTSIVTSAQAKYSFDVKKYGKGQPIILIPGYSCSGEVWKETVAHWNNKYEVHVLTLPGFAGVPPMEKEAILQEVRDQIITYVKENKLKKPMLMGHSLGAFMTLWLHSTAPDLFGKSICVDGLPFISAIGNPAAKAEDLKKMPMYDAKTVVASMQSIPSDNYVKNMTKSLSSQVTDTIRAKQIAEWSFASDRATLGKTIVEMATTDLRQDIRKIKENILVLTSFWGSKEASEKEYATQYALLQNKTILVSEGKHFIMYDTPEWFYNAIDTFFQTK